MFNCVLTKYASEYRLRLFENFCFNHQSPPKPEPEPLFRTPFYDKETYEPIYASMIDEPSDEVIIARKAESLRCSVSRTKRLAKDLALSFGSWTWFGTFTFNDSLVDGYNYDQCLHVISSWLNRMMIKYPDLKYLGCPEIHPTSGRFHFHFLFSADITPELSYAGFFRFSGGHVYHADSYLFGFTNFTIIKHPGRVSSYIIKYITKESCTAIHRHRFLYSRSTLSHCDTKNYFLSNEAIKFVKQCLKNINCGGYTYDVSLKSFKTLQVSDFFFSNNGDFDFIFDSLPPDSCLC